jgi:hypothetical protein
MYPYRQAPLYIKTYSHTHTNGITKTTSSYSGKGKNMYRHKNFKSTPNFRHRSTFSYTACPQMITLISAGYNILTIKLTEWILLQVNLSLTSGELFQYCALNIRCTVTEDFVYANQRTRGLFLVRKPYLKKISSSAPGGKSSTLNIPVGKLHECPSLSAAKFIQLVSLLKYYSQLKLG